MVSDLFNDQPIRAISLWQPWASAIALDRKHFETRGWGTTYRGPLAIHAAKRWCAECRAMHQGQWTANGFPSDLPFGAIVALVELTDCEPTVRVLREITPSEEVWGNYASGRFAWRLGNIRPLREPIPMKGKQGFWTLTPEEQAAVLAAVEDESQ